MFHGRMWGLTTQNNPETTCLNGSDWQAMCWNASQTQEWIIECLGPSLKAYGYEHVKLMILDDDRQFLPEWASTFQTNKTALDYISGFAVHAYDESAEPEVLDNVNHDFPNKFIMSTEYCDRQSLAVALGSWERGEDYARRILQDLNHYVAGWADYNLALDMNGGPSWVKHYCDSPIIVDKNAGVFYKQPAFYILGHFSKFLPPGSKVVNVNYHGDPGLEVPALAAVRPDGNRILVIMNWHTLPQKIYIVDGTLAMEFTMEGNSIHTFTWND